MYANIVAGIAGTTERRKITNGRMKIGVRSNKVITAAAIAESRNE